MMPEHPAEFLARRIREDHYLSETATLDELHRVCAQRGAHVVRRGITRSGYYCDEPYPLIVLRPDARPRILAHELFHHLIADNAAHGITYTGPDWIQSHPEPAAQRFEHLMCPDGET